MNHRHTFVPYHPALGEKSQRKLLETLTPVFQLKLLFQVDETNIQGFFKYLLDLFFLDFSQRVYQVTSN